MLRQLIAENRLRQVERPFGWIPLRLLRDGYWAELSTEAKILYCLLCIVSDRRGVSFYGDARLQQQTGLDRHGVACARLELVQRDLIAIDDGSPTVQLLSLPQRCPPVSARRPDTPRQPSRVQALPPEPPSLPADQQLQAVRQLISTLTTDTRPHSTRSQVHVTQK